MTLEAALRNDIVLTYLLIVATALGVAGLALAVLTFLGKNVGPVWRTYRGWLVMVAFAILPLSQPAEASFWDDLWLNRDQQAQRELRTDKAGASGDQYTHDGTTR